MLSVLGKVLKKEKRKTQNKIDLIVSDDLGNKYSFEVRPKLFSSLVEIDTGGLVSIKYAIEIGEKFNQKTKGISRINNLIVKELQSVY